jgi:iron complex outermembrane receptor protein
MRRHSSITRRLALGCSVATAALLMAQGAFAQDDADTMEEIVVTAQKRTENVQDVPISISVLGAQQIENLHATELADYAAYVPGLVINNGGSPGQVTITLRGLNPLSSTTMVATVIDEAPVGSSAGWARESLFSFDMMPYDLERVEILKGPQGTLYGANSMGGLLKYVTTAPDLNHFQVRAGADVFSIEGADDLGLSGRIAANFPIVQDKLAIRASYYNGTRPGFIDNPSQGREDINELDQQGGRISLLWKPTENTSLKLSAMFQKLDSADNGIVQSPLNGGPTLLNPDARYGVGQPYYGDLTNGFILPQPFKKDVQLYTAVFNADLGAVDFVSATSYSKVKTKQVQDASDIFGFLVEALTGEPGATPFILEMDLERFTQEFRISSPQGGRFEWLLGAYYSDEKVVNDQTIDGVTLDNVPIAPLDNFVFASVPSDYKEIAAFANATFKFTDRFDVTAGVRFAHNKQGFRQITGGLEAVIGPASDVPGKSKESVFTYAISPRFHINDDVMIYGRVASGYRPGGPNVTFPGVPPQIDADTITNYEAGIKAEFLDRKVLFDLAVYHITWKDIQLSTGAGGVSWGINGGTAESSGLELSTAWQPIRDLRFGFNLGYNDAHLTEDVVLVSGGTWRSGDDLPYAPRWTASFVANYRVPLANDWNADMGLGVRYSGESFSQPNHDLLSLKNKAYTALDAHLGVSNDRFKVQLYAKNLTDERAYGANTVGVDIGDNPLYAYSTPIQPRTLGVSLDVTF